MLSSITLYYKTPLLLGNNYIIDNIEDYLNSFDNEKVKIYNDQRFIPFQTQTTVKLKLNPNQLETEKFFNYMKVTSDGYQTAFYFITDIQWCAAGVGLFTIVLDVLNTYQSIEFTDKTLIKRESSDRWDYNNVFHDKINDILFIKRNFPKVIDASDNNKIFINDYKIYPDKIEDANIINNLWIRIIYKDIIKGFCTLCLHYCYDFRVEDSTKHTITEIKSLLNQSPVIIGDQTIDFISLLLRNEDILSINLIPYPPHPNLVNLGHHSLQILYDDQIKPFNAITTSFKVKINDYEASFILSGLELPFLEQFSSISDLNVDLIKITDKTNIFSLNELFFKLLVQKVNNATGLINGLKTGKVQNGVFSNYDNSEIHNKLTFTNVNEPAVLSNSFLSINLDFQGNKIPIYLEDFTVKDNVFEDYCKDSVSKKFDNSSILIQWRNQWIKNGGLIFIKGGNYLNYEEQRNLIVFDYKLPLLTSGAKLEWENENNEEKKKYLLEQQYKKEQQIREQQIEKNMSNKGIFNQALGFLKSIPVSLWYTGKAAFHAAKNWWDNTNFGDAPGTSQNDINVKDMLQTGLGIISGNPFMITRGFSKLLSKQEQNDTKMDINITNFEDAIVQDDIKVNLQLLMTGKAKTTANEYYFLGYPIDRRGKPLHNKRKFFDYLQAEIDIKDNIAINMINLQQIKALFSNGVYYIHKTNQGYVFPTEDIENIENKLLEKL